MKKFLKSPWAKIPTLYFAEGLPYVIVMTLSVIMYKRMGISNADIALYTYLPWVIKPFWSPIVDIIKTKRFWSIIMELFVGAAMAGVAFTIPVSGFFQWSLCFFWLMAFSSATHDIAADGFYMLGLDEHEQSFFVGIRSTFYRIAMLTGQGLLVIFAGYFESSTGLLNVEVKMNSVVEFVESHTLNFDSLKIDNQEFEDMFIIAKAIDNNIVCENISKSKSDSLINLIEDLNIGNNFYSKEKVLKKSDKSWWTVNVSDKLKNYLKSHFGETKVVSETEGNIGFIYFYLSKQPEEDEHIVVNFDKVKGDANFEVAGKQRFVFNSENWNKPAWVAIQLDEKLKRNSEATFQY